MPTSRRWRSAGTTPIAGWWCTAGRCEWWSTWPRNRGRSTWTCPPPTSCSPPGSSPSWTAPPSRCRPRARPSWPPADVRRLLPEPGPLNDAGLVDAYRLPPGRSLRVNFVVSLDGAVTVDGLSKGLGSPGDLRIFRVLRALADVVLVGHGTASAEGYRPITPDSPVGLLRASIGRPPTAPIAVVSRRAALEPDSGLVTDAVSPTILITC